MKNLALAWCVLCALAAHKPAHGHGHYHAQGGPDFFFATEVTQGTLFRAHYTHIKRPPNSRCVFLSALEDTTKMTAHSRATGLPDIAGDRLLVFPATKARGCDPHSSKRVNRFFLVWLSQDKTMYTCDVALGERLLQ